MLQELMPAGGAYNSFGTSREEALEQHLYGQEEVEIAKALAHNGQVGTDGSALNGYDLDRVTRYATLDERNHLPKTRRMHTFDGKALTTEWNRLVSRGTAEGNFRSEGALGVSDSSVLERIKKSMRYLGRTGAVTRALQEAAGGSFGDAKAFEMKEQLIRFLLNMERDIWFAESNLNSLAFDGLFAQASTDSDFNVDLATQDSGGKIIAGGSLLIDNIYGQIDVPISYGGNFTALYVSPRDKAALSQAENGGVRYLQQNQLSNIGIGMKVDQIANVFSPNPLDLVWDIHLGGPRGKYVHTPEDPTKAAKFHSQAPSQLAAAPTFAASAGGFLPDDTYNYAFALVNEVGEGPIKFGASGQATTGSNNSVTATITYPNDIGEAKSVRLYRSTSSNSDYKKMRLVKEVAIPAGALPAGTLDIVDDGSIVPGSRYAVLVDEYSVAMGALEKPVAADLPRIDNTHRFSIDAIATQLLYVQQHMLIFRNIGGSVKDPA